MLLFLAFTAAFAVKMPLFPFHTWSPDAYREAPAAGSLLLAGVMAKLGTYGIIRFDLALFPRAVVTLAPLLLTLGAIGIIYGAIVAAVERDLKRLVAYSSLAHLGFIVIGAFALSREALTGAVLQMVNHGLYTAALFILIAVLYRRLGTFSVREMRGLQRRVPVLAGVFTVVMLASIGVPGLNGFVGEFLILAGTFLTHRWWAVVATAGVVLAAVYLLWAYQQAFQGKPTVEPGAIRDLSWREGLTLAPLVILIVLLGHLPGAAAEPHRPVGDPGRRPRRGRGPPASAAGRSARRSRARPTERSHEPRRRPFGPVRPGSPGDLRHASRELRGDPPRADPHRRSPRAARRPASSCSRRCRRPSTRSAPARSRPRRSSPRSSSGTTCRRVGRSPPIADSVAVDGFAVVFLVLVSCILILASAIANDFLVREGIEGPEYHVLALLAGSGAMLMASANDLILIFVALEIMSIPLYILAGMDLEAT